MSAAAVTRVSGAGQAPPTPDIWVEARRSRYRVTWDNHSDTQLSRYSKFLGGRKPNISDRVFWSDGAIIHTISYIDCVGINTINSSTPDLTIMFPSWCRWTVVWGGEEQLISTHTKSFCPNYNI